MTKYAAAGDEPRVTFRGLDELWFQVSGTVCNLACTHCFISCSPQNRSFGFLSLDAVEQGLAAGVRQGVKEYYFTGGEPFLNRDLPEMLERTLAVGPASVLTNGTVLKEEWLRQLQSADERSLYSLEFRVSIDGSTPAMNDPVRGAGAFARAMYGVEQLLAFGFLPIITMTRIWEESEDGNVLDEFREVLRARGYRFPRIKVLPSLKLGAEAARTRGYDRFERITPEMWRDYDDAQLICSHSRVITDRGVYVCPILLETPAARLSDRLEDSFRPFPVVHGACYTCWQSGAICTNPSAVRREA